MGRSTHGTACILSPRRREGLAIYTGEHPELVMSTGHPDKVTEDNRSQLIKDKQPRGDNLEPPRSWPCFLPAVDHVHALHLQRSLSQPREERSESKQLAADVGQVGTGERSSSCLLSRMFWAGFGFLRGKP